MATPTIPLTDPAAARAALGPALQEAVVRVLNDRRLLAGGEAAAFEAEAAERLGVPHALGCASGADAVQLALEAVGVGRDDLVLLSPFAPHAVAVVRLGARPLVVDVTAGAHTLDPAALEARFAGYSRRDGALRDREGRRVAAVLAADRAGCPCDHAALEALAAGAGLPLVEDATEGVGATWGGRPCGTFGAVAALGLDPTQAVPAAGAAGLVVTRDPALARRVERLRGGAEGRWTSSLDPVQAAILRALLPHLDAWSAERRAQARAYDLALAGLEDVRPPPGPPAPAAAVPTRYVVRAARRDALLEALGAAGVGAAAEPAPPLHLRAAYAFVGGRRGDAPVAETAAGEGLALPLYPGLSEREREAVVDAVRGFAAGRGRVCRGGAPEPSPRQAPDGLS